MNIEDAISGISLPVNAIAMLDRAIEILKENDVNSPDFLEGEADKSYKKCLWLVNQQVYGHYATIDMWDEWRRLTEK